MSQSIRSIGLKDYLNQTAPEHDGRSYEDFVKYMERPKKYRLGPSSMARIFLVSQPTMLKWMAIYEIEKGKK